MNVIITITWKSWSWKSEIASRLEKLLDYKRPKNLTTRVRRKTESWFSDYEHVTEKEFIEEMKQNNLIEYVYFGWNFYWIKKPQWNNIIIAEPLWAIQIKRYCFENNVKYIWLKIECEETERQKRIGNDEKRKSRKEEYFDLFDALYDYKIDNTGNLNKSIQEILEIVKKEIN